MLLASSSTPVMDATTSQPAENLLPIIFLAMREIILEAVEEVDDNLTLTLTANVHAGVVGALRTAPLPFQAKVYESKERGDIIQLLTGEFGVLMQWFPPTVLDRARAYLHDESELCGPEDVEGLRLNVAAARFLKASGAPLNTVISVNPKL